MLCYIAEENCGGRYDVESGTIDYPLGNSTYENDRYCVWNVQLPESSKRIALNVTDFDIADHLSCSYNYLKVSIQKEVMSGK